MRGNGASAHAGSFALTQIGVARMQHPGDPARAEKPDTHSSPAASPAATNSGTGNEQIARRDQERDGVGRLVHAAQAFRRDDARWFPFGDDADPCTVCRLRQRGRTGGGSCRFDHHHHADAVVECAVHLDVVDAGDLCSHAKSSVCGQLPCAWAAAPSRQDARDVLGRPPPVMWARALIGVGERREHRFHVEAGRRHHGFAKGLPSSVAGGASPVRSITCAPG
jgi:hypothetical protein